jgi:hypothetical protein
VEAIRPEFTTAEPEASLPRVRSSVVESIESDEEVDRESDCARRALVVLARVSRSYGDSCSPGGATVPRSHGPPW